MVIFECLSYELQIGDKICNFVALYRSPSQSQDDCETFADNFAMTLELLAQKNPFLLTAIGDFNAKSSNWYNKDKTSFEGNTIENLTSQFGLHQIINEPTHILPNSSSCIDLIFTSQPNQVFILLFRLFLQNLIWKYVTHHHIQEKSGISKKRKLISLEEH